MGVRMDVLLTLAVVYALIRVITKKRLRDLPIRWSFVLLVLAFGPVAYFVFGLLEREGVIEEIYEFHAHSAMLGGIFGMILFSPALLTFAVLSFIKERKAKTVKRPINHVRNLQYSIAATVLIAIVVSVANPINGWVFGLITIVIVTLPLTLITVIVQNVVTRRNPPAAEPKTASAEVDTAPLEAASDMDDALEAARSFKVAGRVHLGIGLFVLILAVVNLFIVQTLGVWTRMFAEPFWWIIAACSIVSFVLANKNFYKAEQLSPKQENSGQNHG
jgi:hypothetical protein